MGAKPGSVLAPLLALLSLAPSAAHAESGGIVDVTVAFDVENVNRTTLPCQPDGRRYHVRGSLVAPASSLADPRPSSVTVYVHGSGNGSFWHFTGSDDYDYALQMAKRGHASVVLDTLGYGRSDMPDGNGLCFGSVADIVHQVAGKLRTGDYDAARMRPPTFDRVAVAGHSGGGIVAEIVAHSFPESIDALVVASWNGVAIEPTSPFGPRAVELGIRCAQGGEPKRTGAPGGYGFLFTPDDWRRPPLFHNAEPDIVEAFIDRYEREACGLVSDAGAALIENEILIATVEVPVLVVDGDRAGFLPGSAELVRSRFVSSDDTSVEIVGDWGHMLTLQRTAPEFISVMSGWLKARGF